MRRLFNATLRELDSILEQDKSIPPPRYRRYRLFLEQVDDTLSRAPVLEKENERLQARVDELEPPDAEVETVLENGEGGEGQGQEGQGAAEVVQPPADPPPPPPPPPAPGPQTTQTRLPQTKKGR